MPLPKKIPPDLKVQIRGGRTVTAAETTAPGAIAREARKALGLSQVELAKRLGVTQATISRYERGDNEREPLSRGNVLLLALTLRINPVRLDPSLAGLVVVDYS